LNPKSINGVGFMVNKQPVAVYGAGLKLGSEEFIREFNASYWEHQLSLVTSVPKDQLTHHHVTFLRLTLSHAEEHLFALIFACLQAPHCPDLWLYRYKPSDLPEMVGKIEAGETILTRFGLKEFSWLEIVKALWPGLEDNRYRLTVLTLGRLAGHFVSTFGRNEYNGLKHGMRLSFGGTALSFSPGGSPDVAPSPESFIKLGDSKFGSRFWEFDQVQGSKNHYKAKFRLSNWDFEELGFHLTHAIFLISNMGAAFRAHAQIEGDREFGFFPEDTAYEEVPSMQHGGLRMEMVSHFELSASQLLRLEDVRKLYS